MRWAGTLIIGRLKLPRSPENREREERFGKCNSDCREPNGNDFLLEVGIDNTARAIQALGDRVWDGVTALGFETLGRRTPETGAGIVSFRKPGVESQMIVRKLKDANIVTAPRQGWVRTAPHFYIAAEEIDRMIGELKTL